MILTPEAGKRRKRQLFLVKKQRAPVLAREGCSLVTLVAWAMFTFQLCSDTITECLAGQRVALYDAVKLCSIGEHQGPAGCAGPAPGMQGAAAFFLGGFKQRDQEEREGLCCTCTGARPGA